MESRQLHGKTEENSVCLALVSHFPANAPHPQVVWPYQQCGEVSYSDEVSERLERIVDNVKKSPVEISISNYAA